MTDETYLWVICISFLYSVGTNIPNPLSPWACHNEHSSLLEYIIELLVYWIFIQALFIDHPILNQT